MDAVTVGERLHPIGEDIWIAEGGRVPFLALSLPTRMTVVRLRRGGLWIHSPVALDDQLAAEVAELGPVQEIIAPNKYHHLFLTDWARNYPDARLHAAPGLRAKRPDITFATDLGATADSRWAGEIDQVVFAGSRSFEEVLFFHAKSSTAILTDLIVNLPLEDQAPIARLVARLDAVAYPRGGVPNLYKLSVYDRSLARAAVDHLLGWRPRQAVISHGEWFRREAEDALRSRFAWLSRA